MLFKYYKNQAKKRAGNRAGARGKIRSENRTGAMVILAPPNYYLLTIHYYLKKRSLPFKEATFNFYLLTFILITVVLSLERTFLTDTKIFRLCRS